MFAAHLRSTIAIDLFRYWTAKGLPPGAPPLVQEIWEAEVPNREHAYLVERRTDRFRVEWAGSELRGRNGAIMRGAWLDDIFPVNHRRLVEPLAASLSLESPVVLRRRMRAGEQPWRQVETLSLPLSDGDSAAFVLGTTVLLDPPAGRVEEQHAEPELETEVLGWFRWDPDLDFWSFRELQPPES